MTIVPITPPTHAGPSSLKLPIRTRLDLHDKHLFGKTGGEAVVAALRRVRRVKQLVLGHNEFGDDGLQVIMAYLCTTEGRKIPIEELSLNMTGIDDRGFDAVADYLQHNATLRGLHLQHNNIQGRNGTTTRFVRALNSSWLQTLNLTHNVALSDPFLSEFLPQLKAPHLRELKLSMITLTPLSTPTITQFLSSPASYRLQSLKLNGNQLDLQCLSNIRHLLETDNFSLTSVELYANNILSCDAKEDHFRGIQAAIVRNTDLTKVTRQEALALLPVARSLLLSRSLPLPPPNPTSARVPLPRRAAKPAPVWKIASSPSPAGSHQDSFLFSLPTEVLLHILSHLSPTLSPPQRVRIFKFASDPSTLPSLKCGVAFPSFVVETTPCVGDPTATMMSGMVCTGDAKTCLGPGKSIICGREEKRNWWLEQVGCDRFESDDALPVSEREGGRYSPTPSNLTDKTQIKV